MFEIGRTYLVTDTRIATSVTCVAISSDELIVQSSYLTALLGVSKRAKLRKEYFDFVEELTFIEAGTDHGNDSK